MKKNNAAFTLIELLVVIAIIAILVAIIVPVISGAREAGWKAHCGATMKGLAGAAIEFTGDNNDILPSAGTANPNNKIWVVTLASYLGVDTEGQGDGAIIQRVSKNKLAACPKALREYPSVNPNYKRSMAINFEAFTPFDANGAVANRYMQNIEIPSKMMTFMDGPFNGTTWGYTIKVSHAVSNDAVYIHKPGASNVAFFDGHVVFTLREDVPKEKTSATVFRETNYSPLMFWTGQITSP